MLVVKLELMAENMGTALQWKAKLASDIIVVFQSLFKRLVEIEMNNLGQKAQYVLERLTI